MTTFRSGDVYWGEWERHTYGTITLFVGQQSVSPAELSGASSSLVSRSSLSLVLAVRGQPQPAQPALWYCGVPANMAANSTHQQIPTTLWKVSSSSAPFLEHQLIVKQPQLTVNQQWPGLWGCHGEKWRGKVFSWPFNCVCEVNKRFRKGYNILFSDNKACSLLWHSDYTAVFTHLTDYALWAMSYFITWKHTKGLFPVTSYLHLLPLSFRCNIETNSRVISCRWNSSHFVEKLQYFGQYYADMVRQGLERRQHLRSAEFNLECTDPHNRQVRSKK